MSQLGRISGPLLADNLVRNGLDLSFRNNSADDDLLVLDVTGGRLSINPNGSMSSTLNVINTTHTPNLITTTQATLNRITASTNIFSTTTVESIRIIPNQSNPWVTMPEMKTSDLDFNDNIISNYKTNGSIFFDPNGTGIVEFNSNSTVRGDLTATGNMQISGNLTDAESIIVGDSPLDVVVIAPDFTQSLIPGQHLTYDLGQQANDSSPRRWGQIHVHSNSNILNLTYNSFTIGQQLQIDPATASIYTLQSNDGVRLLPDTGITDIERIRIQGDTITNLDPTAFTVASTGIGYVRFVATNGIVLPAGTNAERPASPEVGDTRWNTEDPGNNYLECYDGSVWIISTGLGGTVNQAEMNDLGNVWSLILG
jgi:hypothetical protein